MVNIQAGGEHNGVDISTGKNSNIYSIVKGTITNKGYDETGWGHYVCMKNDANEQGFLFRTHERGKHIKCWR